MDKLDIKEKIWGGIFGVVAIAAAIAEMFIGGVTAASVAGMIKDVAGTFIVVILFVVVLKSLLPAGSVDFRQALTAEMQQIKAKYSPLISEDSAEGIIRYNIASNVDSLFGKEAKSYKRLFELPEREPTYIQFFINKSFFSAPGKDDFNSISIAEIICAKLTKSFTQYKVTYGAVGTNAMVKMDFGEALSTMDDVKCLSNIIDYTILLFVAENKS